ncbi:MAG TPA: hypothetical protein PLD82_09230 [Spirochaetota bacterium]|nr:hypothetical protein [Spirochaetota bacterium]
MDRFARTSIFPDGNCLPRKELSVPEQPEPRCLRPGNQGIALIKNQPPLEHHPLDGQSFIKTLRFEITAADAGHEIRSLCGIQVRNQEEIASLQHKSIDGVLPQDSLAENPLAIETDPGMIDDHLSLTGTDPQDTIVHSRA